jgi:hypothetical protein
VRGRLSCRRGPPIGLYSTASPDALVARTAERKARRGSRPPDTGLDSVAGLYALFGPGDRLDAEAAERCRYSFDLSMLPIHRMTSHADIGNN